LALPCESGVVLLVGHAIGSADSVTRGVLSSSTSVSCGASFSY
jgi:hypothetical protein